MGAQETCGVYPWLEDKLDCNWSLDENEIKSLKGFLRDKYSSLWESALFYDENTKLMLRTWIKPNYNTREVWIDDPARAVLYAVNILLWNSDENRKFRLNKWLIQRFQTNNNISVTWNIWPLTIEKILSSDFTSSANRKVDVDKAEKEELSYGAVESIVKSISWRLHSTKNLCSWETQKLLSALSSKFNLVSELPWAMELSWNSINVYTKNNSVHLTLAKYWNRYITFWDALDIYKVIDYKDLDSNWELISDLPNKLNLKLKGNSIYDIAVSEYKFDWKRVWHRFLVYVEWSDIKILDYYYPRPTDNLRSNMKLQSFDTWFNYFKNKNQTTWPKAARFKIIGIYQ